MKVQAYSLDDIFNKRLLILIPFYIFSHEDNFQEYNHNEQKLADLKSEYKDIRNRLDSLEEQGIIGAFDKRTIIELSNDVIKEITQKFENIKKGVGDIMGGALLETEARSILNQGISQGISQGIRQGISQGIRQGKLLGIDEAKKETAVRMLKKRKLHIEEIAAYAELTVEEVEQLAKNL